MSVLVALRSGFTRGWREGRSLQRSAMLLVLKACMFVIALMVLVLLFGSLR